MRTKETTVAQHLQLGQGLGPMIRPSRFTKQGATRALMERLVWWNPTEHELERTARGDEVLRALEREHLVRFYAGPSGDCFYVGELLPQERQARRFYGGQSVEVLIVSVGWVGARFEVGTDPLNDRPVAKVVAWPFECRCLNKAPLFIRHPLTSVLGPDYDDE